MFCNKCGNEIADGVKFCTSCGAPIEEAAQTVNAEANAGFEQPVPPIIQNVDNMAIFERQTASKKDYLKKYAPQNIKQLNLVRIILSCVCVAALVFNLFYSLSISIVEIPIIKMVSDASGEDFVEQFEDAADDLDDVLDEYVSPAEKKEFENKFDLDADEFIEDFEDLADTPSLIRFSKIVSKYEDVIADNGSTDLDELDAFNIAITIITICFLIGFLFALLGIIFAKQGLIITGHIFTLIFTMLFAGIIPTIITFALITALSVVLSMINRNYRKFKKGQAF